MYFIHRVSLNNLCFIQQFVTIGWEFFLCVCEQYADTFKVFACMSVHVYVLYESMHCKVKVSFEGYGLNYHNGAL